MKRAIPVEPAVWQNLKTQAIQPEGLTEEL